MKKYAIFYVLLLTTVVGMTAVVLAFPREASAQSAQIQICWRDRTVMVPTYLVSRYIAAGATVGPCTR